MPSRLSSRNPITPTSGVTSARATAPSTSSRKPSGTVTSGFSSSTHGPAVSRHPRLTAAANQVVVEPPHGHAAEPGHAGREPVRRRGVIDHPHLGRSGADGRRPPELPHEAGGVLPLTVVDDNDGQLGGRRCDRSVRREAAVVTGCGHGRVRRGAVWRVSQGHEGSFPVPAAGPPAVAR
ncbi:hypothetical protein [Frigoriglobus tundricola]|uniref:hypothetical protein n=1 Tax=Frigoriglobus tundricola TaxID=2774151 RepID=UPI00148ECAC6|nr:hypothetical protein [Frigoriglobus tundricola]